jgi:hypothetical protein
VGLVLVLGAVGLVAWAQRSGAPAAQAATLRATPDEATIEAS